MVKIIPNTITDMVKNILNNKMIMTLSKITIKYNDEYYQYEGNEYNSTGAGEEQEQGEAETPATEHRTAASAGILAIEAPSVPSIIIVSILWWVPICLVFIQFQNFNVNWYLDKTV